MIRRKRHMFGLKEPSSRHLSPILEMTLAQDFIQQYGKTLGSVDFYVVGACLFLVDYFLYIVDFL